MSTNRGRAGSAHTWASSPTARMEKIHLVALEEAELVERDLREVQSLLERTQLVDQLVEDGSGERGGSPRLLGAANRCVHRPNL